MKLGSFNNGFVLAIALLSIWTLGTDSRSGAYMAKNGHANFHHTPSPGWVGDSSANKLERLVVEMMSLRHIGDLKQSQKIMKAIQSFPVQSEYEPMLILLCELEDGLSSRVGRFEENYQRYKKLLAYWQKCPRQYFRDRFLYVETKFYLYAYRQQSFNNQLAKEVARELDLDFTKVAQKYVQSLQNVSRNGNTAIYSRTAFEAALFAASSYDFESALEYMETAIKHAPCDFLKADYLKFKFRYCLNLSRFDQAAKCLDGLMQFKDLDWTENWVACGFSEIDYLNGSFDTAIGQLQEFYESEEFEKSPIEVQRKAVALLVRAFCQLKNSEQAQVFAKIIRGRRRMAGPIDGMVEVLVRLEEAQENGLSIGKASELLTQIDQFQKRSRKSDLHYQKEVFDLRMMVATSVNGNSDLIADQIKKKREYTNGIQAQRDEFGNVLNHVSQVATTDSNDGLLEAHRSVAELNNKVNLIIFGGILAGVMMGIGVIFRVRSTAKKTQMALIEKMNERETEFQEKIERQIEAHSKVMLHQVEFNQKIELELERKRRTDVLGILTGGVAHDFNNLLFVIQQSTENIRNQYSSTLDVEGIGLLDEADKAISIGKEIVDCLLSYAREQKLSETAVNLSRFFGEISPLLKSICGKEIEIAIDCEDDGLEILIDKGLLTTSIINLCVNSRDALNGSGVIDIQCINSNRKPEVEIRVSDSGCGIEESQLESIFDPFYSSKESSPFSGNGIGLSMVQGFVTQSGGQIEIESTLGKGTTVILTFPHNRTQRTIESAFHSADFSGRSVLLVDDNPMVRKSMYKTLEKLGCDVFTSDGFEESMNYFQSDRAIELVVTDVQLSGSKTGIELARWIKSNFADTGVILISGGVLTEVPFGCQFLPKPFSTSQLVEKMNEVLKTRHSAG